MLLSIDKESFLNWLLEKYMYSPEYTFQKSNLYFLRIEHLE